MIFKAIKEHLGDSSDLFTTIGALTTGIIAFKIAIYLFRFLSTYFFADVLGLSANLKKAGSWAVVTGSTDGIGKAYAEQLASRGLNVVLISRTLSKLTDLASDIESRYGVETRVIAADFSSDDIYDNIERELTDLDIGVLVNNVGMSYEFPQFYAKIDDPNFIRDMIHMNCTSVSKMTKIVLPGMVERKRGYVINVGSSSATNAVPLLTLYSATKAFVEVFSRALHYESQWKGITVQCVRPYFVVSKLSKFRRASLFVPSPTTFVKSALNTVGLTNNTTGYWAHALQPVPGNELGCKGSWRGIDHIAHGVPVNVKIQDFYMQFIPASVTLDFMAQARRKALQKKAAAEKKK